MRLEGGNNMALIKETHLEDLGITASYWRVKYLSLDADGEEGSFSIGLYARKGLKKPLKTICITEMMGNSDKTLYNKYFRDLGKTYKDWQTACYMFAKENIDFFKDALDDPEEVL